jgi:signal transduction histidine kinase
VQFDYSSEGELWAEFDGARMHQVLTNLLNNAIQHG